MKYIEMTIDEAEKVLNKNKKVLVSVLDLAEDDINNPFVVKSKEDYNVLLEDVETVASLCDDFAKQLRLFTEKQNIYHIRRTGKLKTVLFLQE